VAIAPGGKVYDGVVDLVDGKIVQWKHTDGVQPLITMEDLQLVEKLARKDPKIIEQCEISGIPREDMDKVYCDRMFAPGFPVLFPNLTAGLNDAQLGPSGTTNDLETGFACSRR
jgi:Cu2+-containing amine oxidase